MYFLWLSIRTTNWSLVYCWRCGYDCYDPLLQRHLVYWRQFTTQITSQRGCPKLCLASLCDIPSGGLTVDAVLQALIWRGWWDECLCKLYNLLCHKVQGGRGDWLLIGVKGTVETSLFHVLTCFGRLKYFNGVVLLGQSYGGTHGREGQGPLSDWRVSVQKPSCWHVFDPWISLLIDKFSTASWTLNMKWYSQSMSKLQLSFKMDATQRNALRIVSTLKALAKEGISIQEEDTSFISRLVDVLYKWSCWWQSKMGVS